MAPNNSNQFIRNQNSVGISMTITAAMQPIARAPNCRIRKYSGSPMSRSASDIEAELTITVPKTISAIRAANDGASTL